ncbi:hypothetical protein ACIA58_07135 [Kribbella sp. NPDC051586]|uniref:hypothetical protein n=1 Tax=Kribbella sp. NPDC051586 TaxID=3364118 RepID=UPI0037979D67
MTRRRGCLGFLRRSEQVLGGVQRKAEGEARSGVLRASPSNAALCPPSAAQ